MTAKRQKLYEGKAKVIFAGDTDDTLIQYFKDDATAYNAQKHAVLHGKGVLNNAISCHIMTLLAEAGIKHHLIRQISPREADYSQMHHHSGGGGGAEYRYRFYGSKAGGGRIFLSNLAHLSKRRWWSII